MIYEQCPKDKVVIGIYQMEFVKRVNSKDNTNGGLV